MKTLVTVITLLDVGLLKDDVLTTPGSKVIYLIIDKYSHGCVSSALYSAIITHNLYFVEKPVKMSCDK
jgi:hypothetical protein